MKIRSSRSTNRTPIRSVAVKVFAFVGLILAAEVGAQNTHGRLRVISGCSQPMWIQWLLGNGGGTLNAPNFVKLDGVGTSEVFNIPDTGLAGFRVWPGFGCDANGQNCQIGASGGPADQGFSCPAGIGCAPPIDTKFEGTFGCIPGASPCLPNPSGGGPLGPTDWWDASFVDGYTVPIKVQLNGSCSSGPPGGVYDCSALSLNKCPASENLSTNGQFPALSNQSLVLNHPNSDGTYSNTPVGCFSPASKLTSGQWQSIPNPPFHGTTYNPTDAQAQMYACPTPPISSAQCNAGPAPNTNYTKTIHAACNAYAYAYDDGIGLEQCSSATNMEYDVTFYCPSGAPPPPPGGYNVNGIYSDGTSFSGGGLDNDGYAYSSSQLGSSLTWNGTSFTFGPVNAADAYSSETIPLPSGHYGALNLLATGLNGNQTGQVFGVTYADGSTATFTQSLSDWFTPQNYSGESVALGTSHRNTSSGGTQSGTFNLYGYSFAIDSTRTLQSLTLPNNRNVVVLGAVPNLNGAHTLTPQNATGLRLDDWQASTASGNPIDVYTANQTGAQTWVFGNANVVPAGYYNLAVSFGAYCMTASGSTSDSLVQLDPCNGSSAQAWQAVPMGNSFVFHPANNPSLCLDVQGNGTTAGTLVMAHTCNYNSNEQWMLN